MPAAVHNGGSMTRSNGRRNSHLDYFRMPGGYFSGANFAERIKAEVQLLRIHLPRTRANSVGFLRSV
jgi:hypothetical protein